MSKRRKSGGLIFVISGPSGSGKTTLLAKLLKSRELNRRLERVISFTTRPQRSGEEDKRDYFFISQEEFRCQRKAKKFLEWTKYLGYYYATPRDFVEKHLKKRRYIILCLDLKGTLKIKRLYPKNTVTIFIVPPSIKALQDRIRSRCNKTRKQEIRERLRLARRELLASGRYDYCLVNKNFHQTKKELADIIKRNIISNNMQKSKSQIQNKSDVK